MRELPTLFAATGGYGSVLVTFLWLILIAAAVWFCIWRLLSVGEKPAVREDSEDADEITEP